MSTKPISRHIYSLRKIYLNCLAVYQTTNCLNSPACNILLITMAILFWLATKFICTFKTATLPISPLPPSTNKVYFISVSGEHHTTTVSPTLEMPLENYGLSKKKTFKKFMHPESFWMENIIKYTYHKNVPQGCCDDLACKRKWGNTYNKLMKLFKI